MGKEEGNKSIKDILLVSVKQSTIRGAGRTVSDRPMVIRILWTLAILTCLAISVRNGIRLFAEFYENPIITKVVEKTDSGLHFPSVTVCNHNPLPSNVKEHSSGNKRFLSLSEYFKKTKMFLTFTLEDLGEYKKEDYEFSMYTLHGYFQYVREDVASQLGHLQESLIRKCMYVTSYRGKEDCKNIAHVKEILNPNFFKCFTITVNDTVNDDQSKHKNENVNTVKRPLQIQELHLILFLDNFDRGESIKFFNAGEVSGQTQGARVVIHNPGSQPNINMDGIDIPAGYSASLPMQVKMRHLLGQPYSNCHNQQLSYTAHDCKNVCIQKQIIAMCNCRKVDFYTENTNVTIPFCDALSENLEEFQKSQKCVHRVIENEGIVEKCVQNCPEPCETVSYDARLNLAQWPQKKYQMAFYRQFIKDSDEKYKHKVDGFDSIKESMDKNMTEGFAYLYESNIIGNNFIKIRIYFPNYNVIKVTDDAKYTTESFLGSFGGILNFYSGITMLCLVELIELGYKMLMHLRNNIKLKPKINDAGSSK